MSGAYNPIALNDGSRAAACGTCGAFGICCVCSGGLTQLNPAFLPNTLGFKLIKVADCLRDQYTRFGLRPYIVRVIRTRWSGNKRGVGSEAVVGMLPILPTPLVSDMTSLTEVLQPVGLDEVGGITLSEISGKYSEDQLLGFNTEGKAPEPNEQVYYEIEFQRPCGPNDKRRFRVRSAPHYQADEFEWRVNLERSHEDRARNGDPT